jgi:hypothetical protein
MRMICLPSCCLPYQVGGFFCYTRCSLSVILSVAGVKDCARSIQHHAPSQIVATRFNGRGNIASLGTYAWNEQGKIRGEFAYPREFQRVGGTHNQGHLPVAIPTMGCQEGYPFIKWQLPMKGRLN